MSEANGQLHPLRQTSHELKEALRALLESEVGRQTLLTLAKGQGTATEDGKTWLRAQQLLLGLEGSDAEMLWPRSRDTARLEDMSPNGHLRVGLDSSGDAIVEVFDGESFARVEFCSGAGGGGRSPRVREALIALMVAIEEDNLEDTSGARRHPRYGDIYT